MTIAPKVLLKNFIRTLPIKKQQILVPLVVLLLSVFAFIFEPSLAADFIYHQDDISQGHYWQLITAHFFHTNFNHLLLNTAGLVLLWSLHGRFYTLTNYLSLFTFSALITGLGLYFFSPEINQYVGLSGVLHGIFVWGALADIKSADKTGYLLFIGVWLKIIHEQIYGASTATTAMISANVAIDAHLYGAIAGVAIFIFHQGLLKKRINSSIFFK